MVNIKTPVKNYITDIYMMAGLILIGILCLWYQVFYGSSVNDLALFNIFSYSANALLFNDPSSFTINREVASVIPALSMPLTYAPGIYAITKLISLINESHLTMNFVLLFLQLLNIFFLYFLLRKVSNRFISFSLTLFLIAYTSHVVVVVDSFIQPLLSMILYLLVLRDEKKNYPIIFICGILAGMVWFIRQNTGLFLSCSIITWLLFSHLSINDGKTKSGRIFLLTIILGYLVCGILLIKIIGHIDDKIWYALCYLVFWGFFLKYILERKNIGLDIAEFIKDAGLFLLPIFIIIACWFYAFGKIVGLGKYFHTQYLLPFNFIDVFQYPISFHLNLAWKGFLQNIVQGGLRSLFDSFMFLMRWGALFLIPFVFNCLFVAYGIFQVITKKTIDKLDLKMIAFPVIGIFVFYPIESYWILSSKLIIFFLPLAYFLNKLFPKRDLALYPICFIFLILASPRILTMPFNYAKGEYSKRYALYKPVSKKENLRLPNDICTQLQKAINLIQNTVGNSRVYIVNSYTDMEMLYSLINYKYPNYYVYLRKDAMNDAANRDLMDRLAGYPYILINQRDLWEYQSNRGEYLARRVSISDAIMEYIVRNYIIVARYDKPDNVKDGSFASFFIMQNK